MIYLLNIYMYFLICHILSLFLLGCCSLVSLSSKLADEIDLVLFCGSTVSSVSVLEEELYLSNELDLFHDMSLSDSLLIGFLSLVLDACGLSVFKLPITSLTASSVVGTNGLFEDMIFCLDIF